MEYRDIYTADGACTGKRIAKGEALTAGEYLYHVHIIMKNADGLYVMQQRSFKAKHSAGQWDVTGGGVTHGETGAEAAAREALEELGIRIDPKDALLAGRQVEHWDVGGLITDIYAAWVDVDPENLTLSPREVEAARLVPFEEFAETVTYNKTGEYRRLLEAIDRILR